MLIRMDLIDMLEAGGYAIMESSTGDGALALVDSCASLHGLVTDINLGSAVDGWSVARHARLKFPGLGVVYITGDSADEWHAEQVADSMLLHKPFNETTVLGAVATTLRSPRS